MRRSAFNSSSCVLLELRKLDSFSVLVVLSPLESSKTETVYYTNQTANTSADRKLERDNSTAISNLEAVSSQ